MFLIYAEIARVPTNAHLCPCLYVFAPVRVHACFATCTHACRHRRPLAHVCPCTRMPARPYTLTNPQARSRDPPRRGDPRRETGRIRVPSQECASPAKDRGPTAPGSRRLSLGVVARLGAWCWVNWVRMGCEAAWHARQKLLTLFSSGGTLPSQGLAASVKEAGGGQRMGWGGGRRGAGGSWGFPALWDS